MGAEHDKGTVRWLSLRTLGTSRGGAFDETGTVDFEASYLASNIVRVHRENSAFRREDDKWVYVTGNIATGAGLAGPVRIGRKDNCPRGFGKKI